MTVLAADGPVNMAFGDISEVSWRLKQENANYLVLIR